MSKTTCNYPECNCPFDMDQNNKCLRGYPRASNIELPPSAKHLDCLNDKGFCGECAHCIEWDRTADIEGFEERKRQRIAEEQEY